ncbi:serine hydrolase domain-containing protein [Natronincola ferrireducens]|uniref:CubicO group peptidase, beta-lactamase class C family n=1 Tax=Natronincola ferrireducens TaxID=393762 RepID=A0A1G8Z9J5_9FIRM|nr:serine hydrolase domain-containing protein [Natronincola ferrireducens]SDK11324.1 CubicO group peptidase, beta-lactamase class C family [Natronincola ferrireducens]
MVNEKLLNDLLNKMVNNKRIFSAVLCVENSDKSFSWTGTAGNMEKDSRFFIASVTKLYVTAVVMCLIEEKRMALTDKISKYLPDHYCEGLHVLKGVDYSDKLTIYHLISNTSGLPDYFFHKQDNGRTVADALMEGNDEPWPLDKTIDLIKNLTPNFKPGAKGKAAYSDSNYQLLGKIIENVTGKPIGEVFHDYIFSQLNLSHTYVYNDLNDNTPVAFYYNSDELWLPHYMTSAGVEGGIVSTAEELMLFLKKFFNGYFFPKERINELKQWNLLLPPPGLFYFGIGLEKLWTPRIVSPFKPIKEIVGFWGQTGSFAFYNLDTDLYFCGTTNQINGAGHRLVGSAIAKIIKSVL